MATYKSEMTLGEARALYFELSGFGDGGYQDRWVEIRVGPLPLWFPNTQGRRRAVPFHDVHHILTEYGTSLRGETEIAAWEVATGLRRHHIGWLLDLLGFAAGLVINPRRVYRAFVRGRHSSNFYASEWDDEFLSYKVGELRRQLGLDGEPPPATLRDKLSFVWWAALSAATYALTIPFLFPPVAALSLAVWWSKAQRA